MEIFGIKFAPLNVPLERRLQTLAVATFYTVSIFGNIFAILLFLHLFYTRLWWLNLLYLIWMYYDWDACDKGGHYNSWVLNWKLWQHVGNYFPSTLECTPGFELDPKRNYLFGCYPHGVIPAGPPTAFLHFSSKFHQLYPNFIAKCATIRTNLMVPFLRDYLMAISQIDCGGKSLDYVLSKPEGGHILLLWPGGAEEARFCNQNKIVIKRRKGFIKVALQNGVPIVPVYTFGEVDLFTHYEGAFVRLIQRIVKKLTGYVPLLYCGRGFFQYSFGIIPQRKPLTTVVGCPIEVTKVEHPTNEQIGELYDKFVNEIMKIFEEYKSKFVENPENTFLEMV